MLRLVVSGLVVAGVLTLPATPSSAVRAVDRADRRGDVEVVGSVDGVDPAVVNSVDIRHLTVTHQRDGLRVVVRLRQVLPPRGRWLQVLTFSVLAGTTDRPSILGSAVSLQHVGGSFAFLATLTEDNGDQEPPTCHVTATKVGNFPQGWAPPVPDAVAIRKRG